MRDSPIAWTDATFNPWIGCAKVSPGCARCYAAELDARYRWTPDGWGGGKPRRRTSPAYWRQPETWNRDTPGALVFCGSLCDWLDDEVPRDWLHELTALVERTPRLLWLLLTKRPELWRERLAGTSWVSGFPPNVAAGVSVENQAAADERLPHLLAMPARRRFVSAEPLLSAVTLPPWPPGAVHQVIVGGESGPRARAFSLESLAALVAQTKARGALAYVKQDSGRLPGQQGRIPDGLWRWKERLTL